ncbi:hypothetical protein, partial [Cobetia amphilecti]
PAALLQGRFSLCTEKIGAIESRVQKDVHGKVVREITFPGSTRRKSLAHHRAVIVLSLTKNDVRFFFMPGSAKNLPCSFCCGGVFVRLEAPGMELLAMGPSY